LSCFSKGVEVTSFIWLIQYDRRIIRTIFIHDNAKNATTYPYPNWIRTHDPVLVAILCCKYKPENKQNT
jgi:hypothetical protein